MRYKDSDILSIIKKVRKHNHDNNTSIAVSVNQKTITLKGRKSKLNLNLSDIDEDKLSETLNTIESGQPVNEVATTTNNEITLETLNNKLDHILKILKSNKGIRLKL